MSFLKRIGYFDRAARVRCLPMALPTPAGAVDDNPGGTFLTPFPDNDVYQVTVFGDTFAEGLLAGLTASLHRRRPPQRSSGR